ncbi:MAG: dodecin domain-containing protein, partial [Proteobacteria bacterium]|nr:dodecin domain-containing protein [Pseudomonadota bacterium]
MSVAKIIEVIASSKKSFDDAVQQGISRTADSITDVTGAWIKDQKVVVSKGKIVEYRVLM